MSKLCSFCNKALVAKGHRFCGSNKCAEAAIKLYDEILAIDDYEIQKAKRSFTGEHYRRLKKQVGFLAPLYWLKAWLCIRIGKASGSISAPLEICYWDMAPAIGDVPGVEWTSLVVDKRLISGFDYDIWPEQAYGTGRRLK